MMKIFIGSNELELSDGTALELTDKNIVFSFDDIACQRTTNINIPATPKNMKTFGLSNDFHSGGTICRQRLSAVIYEGLVAISGYLYINNYNHNSKTFNTCFVGGELTNLIAIKDAGKISDILKSVSISSPEWSSLSAAHAANNTTLPNIAYASVKRYSGDPRPSHSVNIILSRLATRFNVTIPQLTGTMARLRIEPAKVNNIPLYTGKFNEDASGGIYAQSVNIDGLAQENTQIFATDSTTYLNSIFGGQSSPYTLMCVEARTPVTITVSGLNTQGTHSYAFIKGGTSQQYAPTQGIVVNGYNNVVNGGEYTFETGDIFTLVDNAQYVNTSTQKGYNAAAFDFTNISFAIESSRELQVGDAVRERDNLPEMTPIELLKMCAALSGGTLLYDAETNAFSYSDLTASGTIELDDMIKVSEQVRTIGSFAQHNTVSFNHDGVRERFWLSVDYPITNENIDENSELLTMDVSEGEPSSNVLVWVKSEDSPTIYTTNAADGNQYCSRITLGRSTAMVNLFANATELTVEMPMPLLQYHALRPLVRIIWRNTAWMWREKQWKSGVCKLKLVKSA